MSVDFNEIRKIINGEKSNIKFNLKNGTKVVKDAYTFRGLSIDATNKIQQITEEGIKEDSEQLSIKSGYKNLDTLTDVRIRAETNIGKIFNQLQSGTKDSVHQLYANLIERAEGGKNCNIRDSIINSRWNIGSYVDPARSSFAFPNIYISPWEANALYSQKGIFENVINKKSKSILLNGINFENPKLSQQQIDKVKENMEVKNLKKTIADLTRDSLVYGGSLCFPLFKKDTPITTSLPASTLIKLGILKKDCIDYFVTLDRWNVLIVPPYNPTSKDFLDPEIYIIPFLGSDVHKSRVARVVTSGQAGYWGKIINQGWGISDFCGYVQSGLNYKVAIKSIPLMIQQMSILARIINIDGILATEGANALDAVIEQNTIRMREASLDNPINLDVMGELKSIDRNFSQVPELMRLLRQDFASDASLPEPLLFSSERGNFSSGDDTQGNLFKQNESVQMIHKDIESSFKQIMKILIIDTLGVSDEIMKALPYTKVTFDQPVIANALDRAQIGKLYSEIVFNLVSARIPIDVAVSMADNNISSDMRTSSDILEQLKEIQSRVDEQDDIRAELEFAREEAEIENIKNSATEDEQNNISRKGSKEGDGKNTKGKSPAEENREKALSDKEEGGYSKLDQKRKEKTRLGSSKRSEKLSKAQNKHV